MTPHIRRVPACFALLLALLVTLIAAPRSEAQQLYLYTVSALGGFGGSIDAEPGDGLTNTGFQLGISYVTEPRTRVGVRLGKIGLGDDEAFNELLDADLTYATVAGEYLFSEPYYDSWVYIGLGAYEVEGTPLFGGDGNESALGGVVGVTGEFHVTQSLDFLVEFSGHYVTFDQSQLFAMGHAGVAFHF